MSSTTALNASASTITVAREISRTPSPTPSEVDAMNKSATKLFLWNLNLKKKRPWYTYLIWVAALTFVILLSVFQDNIINWLHPAVSKMRSLPGGFLIPIAILFVLSFPPLFGQEILAIVVGVVWGVGTGFLIVAVGTTLGEIANFYTYKHFFRKSAERIESGRVKYAMLGRIIREGNLLTAVMARYSILPTHFVTAIFSVCGMNFWVFLASAILSLPLYLSLVFLGHFTEDQDEHRTTSAETAANYIILVVSIVSTILAMWWLGRQMDKVKMDVIQERRKSRAPKVVSSTFDDSSRAELGAVEGAEIGTEYEQPSYGTEYSPVSRSNIPPEYSRTEPPDVDSISTYERAYAAPSLSAPYPVRQQDTSISTLRGFENTIPASGPESYKLQALHR